MSGPGRVLVVEDDPSIQYALTTLLQRDGFDVDSASRGAEVVPTLERFDPQVVLLDLGLPDMSGFDVLRAIRDRSDVQVIVLSGRHAETDRVLALELGADDYVVKPFLNGELVARVNARLRRPADGNGQRDGIRDGDLLLDRRSREVIIDGRPIDLSAKEFDLLELFMSAPRQVFSRQQLLDALWPRVQDWQAESVVTEHIHRLRRKIGQDRIATVRGVGYRYEPA